MIHLNIHLKLNIPELHHMDQAPRVNQIQWMDHCHHLVGSMFLHITRRRTLPHHLKCLRPQLHQ